MTNSDDCLAFRSRTADKPQRPRRRVRHIAEAEAETTRCTETTARYCQRSISLVPCVLYPRTSGSRKSRTTPQMAPQRWRPAMYMSGKAPMPPCPQPQRRVSSPRPTPRRIAPSDEQSECRPLRPYTAHFLRPIPSLQGYPHAYGLKMTARDTNKHLFGFDSILARRWRDFVVLPHNVRSRAARSYVHISTISRCTYS